MVSTLLLAVLSLIPQPREMTELNGVCPTNVNPVCRTDASVPAEGYRLTVEPDSISISSSDAAGEFYARQTLAQLKSTNGYQCAHIVDAPAFRWRGFMLDEGRHFFGKEVVKSVLDHMAEVKLNVFHWHLTEDQGWRVDVSRFPELVKWGSVRKESVRFGCSGVPAKGEQGRDKEILNGEQYGPFFYTPADIAEILAHAKARHIAVVPEFEVPGHVRALLAAHPEFSCKGDLPREPRCRNAVEDEVLCVGNDAAVAFVEAVLDEFCAMFPGVYIHIGGDECPKKRWKECPKCQAKIRSLGLKDEDALQAWLTNRLTRRLAAKGRRAVGWDEIMYGNPGTEAIVQAWRKAEYAAEAAAKGHEVIVSDWSTLYFSVPQGVKDDPYWYLARHRHISLDQVYAYDPLKGIPAERQSKVIGSECCLWSECCWNRFDLEFKLWPRLLAFAEITWTAPKAPRDFEAFSCRAAKYRRYLISEHVNCAPLK